MPHHDGPCPCPCLPVPPESVSGNLCGPCWLWGLLEAELESGEGAEKRLMLPAEKFQDLEETFPLGREEEGPSRAGHILASTPGQLGDGKTEGPS